MRTLTGRWRAGMLATLILICTFTLVACDEQIPPAATADTGVHKASAGDVVQTGSDGLTVEQRNVRDRLAMDNKIGSIKHLYVISPESGQVLIYSTVRGKVTSSGKRLTPTSVTTTSQVMNVRDGIPLQLNGYEYRTGEVLQDDGAYGSSSEYIYWWDTKSIFHQHFITAGQIIHISDQPLAVKSIVLNLELSNEKP